MNDTDQLLQFVSAVRDRRALPATLAVWVASRVTAVVPLVDRLAARDRLLRQAAALVGGGRWARMRALQAAIEDERRQITDPQPPPPGTVADFVHQALLIDPACPSSDSQLLRVLAVSMDEYEDDAALQ